MSDQIEFHDSSVAVERRDGDLVLCLCPAYVHHWDRSPDGWIGEGRSQFAEILIAGGTTDTRPPDGVFEVSDGWIQIADRRYENMIPAPLTTSGIVEGRLDLVNSPPIQFSGSSGVRVRLVGPAEVVEALPQEWAPTGAG